MTDTLPLDGEILPPRVLIIATDDVPAHILAKSLAVELLVGVEHIEITLHDDSAGDLPEVLDMVFREREVGFQISLPDLPDSTALQLQLDVRLLPVPEPSFWEKHREHGRRPGRQPKLRRDMLKRK